MFSNYQIFDDTALAELYELQSEDDPNLVADLIKDYLNQLEANTVAIVNAFHLNDYKTVEALSHSLKSSSRVLGLQRMGEVCFLLEEDGRDRRFNPMFITSLRETSDSSSVALTLFLSKAA
ncbi:MAG: Hpt domain-containing protein [Proteobacteria bacterium]|nr:MAG: Hpt domain-containing protein [Pseudomonadota bacterium]